MASRLPLVWLTALLGSCSSWSPVAEDPASLLMVEPPLVHRLVDLPVQGRLVGLGDVEPTAAAEQLLPAQLLVPEVERGLLADFSQPVPAFSGLQMAGADQPFGSMFSVQMEQSLGTRFLGQMTAHYNHGFFDYDAAGSALGDMDDYRWDWQGVSLTVEFGLRF